VLLRRAGALLVLSTSLASAQPVDEVDWRASPNALGAVLEASDAPNGEALLAWRFEPGSGPVHCALDADGDGRLDYRLPDCRAQSRIRHLFRSEDSGVYFATLLAESADGRRGLARAAVDVR
jgi:hypothetical protein